MRNAILSLLLAFILPTVASATTYVIDPAGTGSFPTIQDAVNASVDGDIIELTDGTFLGDGNRDIDLLGKAITVRSQSGDPTACILDLQGNPAEHHRGFSAVTGEGSGTVLEGFQIANGYFMQGAGVFCQGTSPTLVNMLLYNNTANLYGGGLYCQQGGPALQDCQFVDNWAAYGGGASFRVNVAAELADCYFSENYALRGAGADCELSSPVSFTNCVFDNNTATTEGGGAVGCVTGSDAMLSWCTLTNNTCEGLGGGMVCSAASPTIEHCWFGDNYTWYQGGGLGCYNCTPQVIGCTFVRNYSNTYGGGIACVNNANALIRECTFYANEVPTAPLGNGAGLGAYLAAPTLENTIISFSISGQAVWCYGTILPTLTCCDVYGNEGGDWVDCIAGQYGINGNIAEDPLFCDATGDDFRLTQDSPCGPFTPPNPECDLIGAWPVGCGPSPIEEVSWGAVKAMFRDR